MEGRVSLDDIDLVPTADRLVELTEEMRIARIRPVHRLELEAGIEARRFRIERALYRQQSLVQQEGIGAIRKEMAEIEPVGRPDGITRDATFHVAGNLEGIPPRGQLRRRLELHIGRHGRRTSRNSHYRCYEDSRDRKRT